MKKVQDVFIPNISFVDSVRGTARFGHETNRGVGELGLVKDCLRENDEKEDEECDEEVELEEPLEELEIRYHTSTKVTLNFCRNNDEQCNW